MTLKDIEVSKKRQEEKKKGIIRGLPLQTEDLNDMSTASCFKKYASLICTKLTFRIGGGGV